MILVIDAYNVLKAHERMNDISQRQRHHFIVQLISYAKKKDHTLVVVFDGGSYEWPFTTTVSRGIVVYSGYNKTADDYIRRYLAENKHKDLFLASSDRELIRKARQCGVDHIGGYEFYQKVKEALAVTHQEPLTDVIKLTDRVDDDIDQLMMNATTRMIKSTEKQEDVRYDDGAPAHKKSKIERHLERKIDKL